MNVEYEIQNLKQEVNDLRNAFIQAQINQVSTTSKADNTASQVANITPYTDTKMAYIDDTYVVFENAPDGVVSIFMVNNDGQNVPCEFDRENGNIKVTFEKRDSLATVMLMIQ